MKRVNQKIHARNEQVVNKTRFKDIRLYPSEVHLILVIVNHMEQAMDDLD